MDTTFEMWRPYHLTPEMRAKIDGLAPLLKECEAEGINERRFPQRGIDAMYDAGLFQLCTAPEVGGVETHPVLQMEIYEAVARISMTAAWNIVVGNVHTGWASAFLSDEAIAEIFPEGHRSVVAGQAAPTGMGQPADGGYRITGKYSWGSGMAHANWVMGGFISPEGEPRVFVTPKSSVNIIDNWFVVGIEGSGSVDFTVEDLFVPFGYTYSFAVPTPLRGSARFAQPFFAQAAVPHTAAALGGGQAAIENIARIAPSKFRMPGAPSLADRGAFQRDLGAAYIQMSSMRDCAARLFEHSAACAVEGKALTEIETQELVAANASANRAAVDLATMAFRYGSGSSVRLDSPFQRVLRDLLVAQTHLATTDTSFEALGGGIMQALASA